MEAEKCPHCNSIVNGEDVEPINGCFTTGDTDSYGVQVIHLFLCGRCGTVFGGQ
ncbi:unnamed protein product [marine sediment metagenome]|uniref:Uncharacterized protein n=1 Tax=marine sediment metagenome TaxID=412755 RepID=X1F108_9ZZZZ